MFLREHDDMISLSETDVIEKKKGAEGSDNVLFI